MANKKTQNLVYLALGGAGEIGMNCYMYGIGEGKNRRWIMVDCGIGFGDMETSPGVELLLPDIAFVRAERARILGIFITHAHEDHIGALPHYWGDLKNVPVYARRFSAEVIRRKLGEAGLDSRPIKQAARGERIELGPFSVEFLDVTHSVPEASCLAIRTPVGTVLHTGDFKLDPSPQLGPPIDMAPFEALGKEGVLALTCDSTNVFLEGNSGSEAEIIPNLKRVIAAASGAVAATTFASNVARLRTLALAARETGRSVVVVGRAMRRMIDIATETGILDDFPTIVREDEASSIPAANLFYLLTGSQGENRAALARIAGDTHPSVSLRAGDTVLFSSKTIPGNEAGIYRLYNRLSERDITVIDGDMERIHVSGHARRGDLERVYQSVRPKISIPMHGEHRHLVEHAKWARRWGVDTALIAPNGTMVRLDETPGPVEHIETGRIYLDGKAQIGALDGVIRDRLKLARQGLIVVSVVVDEDGALFADPLVKCMGMPKNGADNAQEDGEAVITDAVDEAVEGASRKVLRDDKSLEELIMRASRQTANRLWGKKPVVSVLVTRLEEED